MSEELFEKYFEPGLSAEETAELKRLLRQDADAQAVFARFVQERSLLIRATGQLAAARQLASGAIGEDPASAPAPRAAVPRGPQRRAVRVRRGQHRRVRVPAVQPARARAWGWRLTGIAAAVVVGFGLLLAGRLERVRLAAPVRPALAQVAEVRGQVFVLRDVRRTAARTGHALAAGDTVRTGPAGHAGIEWGIGHRLALRAGSELRVGTAAAGRTGPGHVRLAGGRLHVDIEPSLKPPFLVQTPHARIAVVGTRFSVHVTDAHTRTEMDSGTVRITAKATGQDVELRQGHYAITGKDTAVAALAGAGPRPVRAVRDLAVLYRFEAGAGARVPDRAGVGTPIDLRILDPNAVSWLPGGGLRVARPTTLISEQTAERLFAACMRRGEITVEAWLRPAGDVIPQSHPARIVGIASDPLSNINLMLAQGSVSERERARSTRYSVRLRTSATSDIGEPSLVTRTGAVQPRLTHLIFTHDRMGREQFFIDGARVSQREQPADTRLRWEPGRHLTLANEMTHDRGWLGTLYTVAIYCRALTDEEVAANFQAGVPGVQPVAARLP